MVVGESVPSAASQVGSKLSSGNGAHRQKAAVVGRVKSMCGAVFWGNMAAFQRLMRKWGCSLSNNANTVKFGILPPRRPLSLSFKHSIKFLLLVQAVDGRIL